MPRVPIHMAQLGESMAEATVVEIKIAPGDTISADQEIFEVDTDKASMEVTTPCSGTVLDVTATIGKSYAVGATLGYLEATDDEIHRAGLTKPSDTTPIKPLPPKDEKNDNLHFYASPNHVEHRTNMY